MRRRLVGLLLFAPSRNVTDNLLAFLFITGVPAAFFGFKLLFGKPPPSP